jgi:hypothetical protein
MQHIQELINLCSSVPDRFTVEVGGIELHFRNVRDFSELVELGNAAEMFAKAIFENPSPEMSGMLPRTEQSAKSIFMVSALAVEPTPITLIESMRLAKEAGQIFAVVIAAIQEKTAIKSIETEQNAIDESKNESSGTVTGETA